MSKSKLFKFFLATFLGGVAIAPLHVMPDDVFSALGIFGIGIALVATDLRWRVSGILLVAGLVGMWRYQSFVAAAATISIRTHVGHLVSFEGVIVSDPEIKINRRQLIVSAEKIDNSVVNGKVIATVGLYPVYQYGDRLRVSCQLEAPEPFEGFAYDRYLAVQGIYARCSQPRIYVVESGRGNWWVSVVMHVKQKIRNTIVTSLPEPHASLFYALNFGPRGGIPERLYQDFQTTGTTHLIAISGSNMSIIIAMLSVVATHVYIPRRRAFWMITVLLASYIVMIGLPASAVRAASMGFVVLLAQHVGRLPNSGNALLLVASVMVWFNPLILRDDLGFQLSFLAVIGLLYFSDMFSSLVKFVPEQFGIREALQMTLAAQATTTPLLLYNFGRLSLIAPLANIFLVPVLGYLVVAGLPLILLSIVLPSLSQLLLWPIYLLVVYQIKVTEILAIVPWATVTLW